MLAAVASVTSAPPTQTPISGGGRFDFDDGGTYCGDWEDGKAHGHGVCTGPKGQGEYAGQWAYGFEVQGVYTWPSGNNYEGQWMGGKRHGVGVEAKGRWIYRGEWTHGFKGRYGVRQSTSSGAKYEGTWANGLQDGYGIEFYADGGTFQGQWLRGVRHGYGVRTSAPYGLASHYRQSKALRSSLTSLRSEADEDPIRADSLRENDTRGGFVLRTCSDEPPLTRRGSIFSRNKSGSKKIGGGLFSGLKLRKQQSTGDLPQQPTRRPGKASSLNSSSSIQSYVSDGSSIQSAGALTDIDQYDGDSNLSYVSTEEILESNVTEIYMGEWKNDKRAGFGVCDRSDGLKYEGEWFNNKKSGYGITTFKDGTKEEGKYKNNVLVSSSKQRKLLTRSAKIRERIDSSLQAAIRASQMALQKADIAISRTATARGKAESAETQAQTVRGDMAKARVQAKLYAPSFYQPGPDVTKKALIQMGNQVPGVSLTASALLYNNTLRQTPSPRPSFKKPQPQLPPEPPQPEPQPVETATPQPPNLVDVVTCPEPMELCDNSAEQDQTGSISPEAAKVELTDLLENDLAVSLANEFLKAEPVVLQSVEAQLTEPVVVTSVPTLPVEEEVMALEVKPVEANSVITPSVAETQPTEKEVMEMEMEPVVAEPMEEELVELKIVEEELMEPPESVESQPVEPEVVEPQLTELQHMEAEPIESELVELQPEKAEPIESQPQVEAESVESQPQVEAESVESQPVELTPLEAEPIESQPVEAELMVSQPEEMQIVGVSGLSDDDVEDSKASAAPMKAQPADGEKNDIDSEPAAPPNRVPTPAVPQVAVTPVKASPLLAASPASSIASTRIPSPVAPTASPNDVAAASPAPPSAASSGGAPSASPVIIKPFTQLHVSSSSSVPSPQELVIPVSSSPQNSPLPPPSPTHLLPNGGVEYPENFSGSRRGSRGKPVLQRMEGFDADLSGAKFAKVALQADRFSQYGAKREDSGIGSEIGGAAPSVSPGASAGDLGGVSAALVGEALIAEQLEQISLPSLQRRKSLPSLVKRDITGSLRYPEDVETTTATTTTATPETIMIENGTRKRLVATDEQGVSPAPFAAPNLPNPRTPVVLPKAVIAEPIKPTLTKSELNQSFTDLASVDKQVKSEPMSRQQASQLGSQRREEIRKQKELEASQTEFDRFRAQMKTLNPGGPSGEATPPDDDDRLSVCSQGSKASRLSAIHSGIQQLQENNEADEELVAQLASQIQEQQEVDSLMHDYMRERKRQMRLNKRKQELQDQLVIIKQQDENDIERRMDLLPEVNAEFLENASTEELQHVYVLQQREHRRRQLVKRIRYLDRKLKAGEEKQQQREQRRQRRSRHERARRISDDEDDREREESIADRESLKSANLPLALMGEEDRVVEPGADESADVMARIRRGY